MTPDEAEFIALWNAGTEITAMAQRLGIPKGTVQSRAHRLQQRGLIQPRPKGGAYPRQKALARQNQPPVQSSADPPLEAMHPPVHTVHRVQAQLYALHGAVQQEVESPIDLRVLLSDALVPLLAQVTALEAEVKALRMHPLCTGAQQCLCTARCRAERPESRGPEVGALEHLHAPLAQTAHRSRGRGDAPVTQPGPKPRHDFVYLSAH